jgi:dimeric dUTPase (all-alpha-NTP-PPase superfamily)
MYDLFALLRENQLGNVGHFQRAFSLLLGIGAKLGFSDDEIVEGYHTKNAVNHTRQREGY